MRVFHEIHALSVKRSYYEKFSDEGQGQGRLAVFPRGDAIGPTFLEKPEKKLSDFPCSAGSWARLL